jgi:hypothetical protein
MDSALPTAYALRGKKGKIKKRKRERKGNYCSNNTRKVSKNSNS